MNSNAAQPAWWRRWRHVDGLFAAVVLAPTLASAVYFGLVASDMYVSESQFVVRSPERQASVGLGALLKGGAFAQSPEDTYSVQEFMRSRDAMLRIDDSLPLVSAFGRADIDRVSRFNGWGLDDSREALFLYYQNRITVEYDGTSGITRLKVSAFAAEDAARINRLLLSLGEQLVNRLNDRARKDLVSTASEQLAQAERRLQSASAALANFRKKKGVFDPERQSGVQLQLVAKLQDELIANRAQYSQLRALTPDNPQLPGLQRRVQVLQKELDAQMAMVAGADKSLSQSAAEYERLALERSFAEKQLGAAALELEQARNDAKRKQLYLERIVEPGQPDKPLLPRRARNIAATLLLSLMAWGILSMLLAGVREHQD